MPLHRPVLLLWLTRSVVTFSRSKSTALSLSASKQLGARRHNFPAFWRPCRHVILQTTRDAEYSASEVEETKEMEDANVYDNSESSLWDTAVLQNDDSDDLTLEELLGNQASEPSEGVFVGDVLRDEFDEWTKSLDKCLEALRKKERSLENEMKKARDIEKTVGRAQLITSHIYLFSPGVRSAVVQDWEQDGKEVELSLNPSYETAAAEADALFQQARKLKRGSKVVGGLLAETARAIQSLLELQVDLASVSSVDKIDEQTLRLVQDRLIRTSRATGFVPPVKTDDKDKLMTKGVASNSSRQPKTEMGTPASNIRKLSTPGGCTVLVGRNRRGNEFLTFNIARDKDLWLHARGCPGAHVIIMQRRGAPVMTEDCLQLAADLAAFYSDARTERKADISVVEPKHLLKPRGAPLGAVKLRQELKVVVGFPDAVPEQLKEAREASGLSDEYRSADKSKHRKRNRSQLEKQKKAQKKEKA